MKKIDSLFPRFWFEKHQAKENMEKRILKPKKDIFFKIGSIPMNAKVVHCC